MDKEQLGDVLLDKLALLMKVRHILNDKGICAELKNEQVVYYKQVENALATQLKDLDIDDGPQPVFPAPDITASQDTLTIKH